MKEEDSSDYYMGVKNNSTISNISQRDDSINNSEKSKLIYIYIKLTNSTKNFILLNEMFSNCESLLSLPDISKFETNNVIDMSYMFSNCKSLLSLPDISKWNISNVIYMNHIFNNCKSLSSLADISK